MIKLIIFDLDGTILYTLDSVALSTNKTLRDFGYEPLPVEAYKRIVGTGVFDLLQKAFAASGDSIPITDEIMMRFRNYFKEDRNYHLKPYDGMTDLLAALKQKGLLLACNTNKPQPNAELILQEQFGGIFDYIAGQREGVPKKPHPAGGREVMEHFGLKESEVVFIGDSDVDILTARNCSFRSIGAAWGYRGADELKAYGATAIAINPLDCLPIIEQMHD